MALALQSHGVFLNTHQKQTTAPESAVVISAPHDLYFVGSNLIRCGPIAASAISPLFTYTYAATPSR